MTPEEIEKARIAEEARLAAEAENAPLKELQEKLAKAEEDRDNYKKVALQRKGKLPGDQEFFKADESELSVAEQIRIALFDKEVEDVKKAEKEMTQKLIKENSELRLALKNRPGSSMGGDSGASLEVKDNVFSADQLQELKKRAVRLKLDPEKYIANAKINLQKRS